MVRFEQKPLMRYCRSPVFHLIRVAIPLRGAIVRNLAAKRSTVNVSMQEFHAQKCVNAVIAKIFPFDLNMLLIFAKI